VVWLSKSPVFERRGGVVILCILSRLFFKVELYFWMFLVIICVDFLYGWTGVSFSSACLPLSFCWRDLFRLFSLLWGVFFVDLQAFPSSPSFA